MGTLFAVVSVSEPVRHALEVVGQEISEQLAHLSTKEQNEFWAELYGYALVQTRGKARPSLIASPHVKESVRRALQLTDDEIRTQIEKLSAGDHQRFWEVLHESAQRATEESTKGRGGLTASE
jgi:ABC-type cobalamin transport system ATPase subunit